MHNIRFLVLFAFMLFVPRIGLAGEWQELGSGWKFRVDRPTAGEGVGKFHVHVNQGNNEVGCENVDGTPSHGDTLNNVPESIKKKVRDHSEYKKGQKKQQQLNEAMKDIDEKRLNIERSDMRDVLIAAAIVVACTATAFFPADDAVAWVNFFRVVRAAH